MALAQQWAPPAYPQHPRDHAVGRAVEDTAAHLIRVSGAAGTAAARTKGANRSHGVALSATSVAAALTASFHARVEAGAPLRPGAARLLAELERMQMPFALVSASPRMVVDTVVAGALADVPFSFTLSADDTVRTKPHPDPYRAAAARFGAPAGACVAVEDSPDGSASAQAAGCPVLVVPSLLPVPASPGRVFADSLEDVDLDVLRRCVSARETGSG